MLLWTKKITRKNTRTLSNLRLMKNKMATKFLGITLTDNKSHIKLNELI